MGEFPGRPVVGGPTRRSGPPSTGPIRLPVWCRKRCRQALWPGLAFIQPEAGDDRLTARGKSANFLGNHAFF